MKPATFTFLGMNTVKDRTRLQAVRKGMSYAIT